MKDDKYTSVSDALIGVRDHVHKRRYAKAETILEDLVLTFYDRAVEGAKAERPLNVAADAMLIAHYAHVLVLVARLRKGDATDRKGARDSIKEILTAHIQTALEIEGNKANRRTK